jgi:16S rRNA (uracil1498-N3)-methyltransferase
MLNVVRVRAGEEVCLFDGSGDVAYARLLPASAGRQAKRGEAALEIIGRETINVEPARKLTLACALPRSNRMDFLVEKCSELGVKRLIPMVTQRSVVDPLDRQQNHLDRWRRITIEAAKQCGRTRLTELTAALAFDSALVTNEPDAVRMIASPPAPVPGSLPRSGTGGEEAAGEAVQGAPGGISLSAFASRPRPDQPVVAFIGPEGGFTPKELDLAARDGCVAVSLGQRILRVETAAVALAAFLLLGE